MKSPFKKLGLAIAFSPNGKALLLQTKRLQELFDAELVLIHVGEKTDNDEQMLNNLLLPIGFEPGSIKVEWSDGDPVKVIKKKCIDNKVDLLIAGALEEESIITYYLGSVARKLMREAPCSMLVLTNPTEKSLKFEKFCVGVDFSETNTNTILKAYQFALLEKAKSFNLIREFNIPGLMMTVSDTGSMEESDSEIESMLSEEKMKLEMLIKEMNLTGLDFKTTCLFGKEGYESNKYVKANEADIFCLNAPSKRLKFLDRLFTHEIEYTLECLPSNLLIVRE
jgi:nucleotide-binding universal stress UspA family protein